MLLILHGSSTIKVLVILALNYKLAKMEKSGVIERFWPGMVIVGNMLILFLNERNDGYRFAHLHGAFEVVVSQFLAGICQGLMVGPDGGIAPSLAHQLQHHYAQDCLFCSGLSLETGYGCTDCKAES